MGGPRVRRRPADSRVLAVGATRREGEVVREELVGRQRAGRLWGRRARRWPRTCDLVGATAANTLRARSLERYTAMVEQHIVPTVGHLPLERFTEQHVVGLHHTWAGRVSPATIRYHHSVLRSAFRQAVEWRLIDAIPRAVCSHPAVSVIKCALSRWRRPVSSSTGQAATSSRRSTPLPSPPACASANCSACAGRMSRPKRAA